MLVERGLQVMNVEVVGDAYAIASNYLSRTGAIADTFSTDERLLEIIVRIMISPNVDSSNAMDGVIADGGHRFTEESASKQQAVSQF